MPLGAVVEAVRQQSAYALRARDPVFAAGWDAACEIARTQLADALFEKAIDGVTETIIKDGEVVAERHRFDSRLSIAVLNRLDKRCDRSAELGSPHLAVVRNWEDFLTHIGRAEDQSAEALLRAPVPSNVEGPVPTGIEGAPNGQFGQLPLGGSPTGKPEEPKAVDLSDRYWKDEGRWVTDFPPPADFTGWQKGKWSEYGYERDCTPEEAAIIEADVAADEAAELEHEEQLRDAWFRMIAASLEPKEDDEGRGSEEDPENRSATPQRDGGGGETAVR